MYNGYKISIDVVVNFGNGPEVNSYDFYCAFNEELADRIVEREKARITSELKNDYGCNVDASNIFHTIAAIHIEN